MTEGERQALRERDSARHQVRVLTEDIQRVSDALTAERAALTLLRREIADLRASMSDDPKPEPATDVDRVVDALDRRVVPPGDRTRLRRSLDKADAPQAGRAGADEGLGRAIGRVSAMGLRLP